MLWKSEEGAAAVVAAVAFVLIMVITGLVLDLGSVYIRASSLQNAADAAAYAASSILPVKVNDTAKIQQVTELAKDYVQKNGIDESNVEAVELGDIYSSKYFSVRVSLKSNVSYRFVAAVGINGTVINKSAKVKLEPVTSTSGAVPLGIQVSRLSDVLTVTEGQDLVIKYGGGGGTEGFFGALDLDGVRGGGAKDFESWLNFGYDGTLKVGDVLPVESGNMAGATTDAFLSRYNQCTHFTSQGGCNEDHFDPDCPRVVLIIAYTMIDSKNIKVEGFAPFVLEGLNGNGEIVASKINLQVQSGETSGNLGGAGDYGIYRARLVE